MAYVYRGAEVEGIEHGTNNGYYQHRMRGIPACTRCRDAHAEYGRQRARRANPDKRAYNRPAECGTNGGYTKHRRLREKPCVACKAAHSEAQLARYRRKREGVEPKRSPVDTSHGTDGGYRKHIRLKTPTCDPCRIAHAEYVRRNKQKKDAA